MTAPASPAELESALQDSATLQNGSKLSEAISGYVENALTKYGDKLAAQVAEQGQIALAELDKAGQADGARIANRPKLDMTMGGVKTAAKYRAGHNPKAAGAALDNEFVDTGDYAATIWHNRSASNAARLDKIRNAFGSVVPSDGGFLIPEILRSNLLSIALEESIVRSRATVIPMDSLRVPIPIVDSTSNASSVYGGMIGYWTEEAGALTAASATFGRVVLEAKKLTGYSVIPNELFQDSLISLSAFIDQRWPAAINFFEDKAFIRGTGVGEPQGLLSNAATVAVAKESGQVTATIVWENIVKMYSRMLPTSLKSAVWIVSPDTFPELATMALSVGTGGAAVWLPDGTGAPQMTLLGRPVVVSEKLQVLGTQGDIAFADLSYYLVGDRQQMTAASSVDFKFDTDQTAFRIIERVDGRPWLQSAMTPMNAGPTLSAFVELATR